MRENADQKNSECVDFLRSEDEAHVSSMMLILKEYSEVWGLKQSLTTERPLKMMKNNFYFTLNVLFVLKVLKFSSWHFGHVEKQLD